MATQKKEADVVRIVHLKTLRPSELNPRKTFDKDSMKELVESVRTRGVLQPLIVRPTPGGSSDYEVVVGERRYRACVAADVTQVPCIVRELDDEQALELMLAENLMREDLKPLEEAVALKRFIDSGMTQQELAKRIGKSQAWISNRLRMIALPEDLQRMVADGSIGVEHAMAAAPYADKAVAKKIAQNFKDKLAVGRGMTVQEAESMVENALDVKSLVFDLDSRWDHNAYKDYLDLAACKKCATVVKHKEYGNEVHRICLEVKCFRPKIKEAKEKAKAAVARKVENKAKKGKLSLNDLSRDNFHILRQPDGRSGAEFDTGACRKCDSRKDALGYQKAKVVICVDVSCFNKKTEAAAEALRKRVQRLRENLVSNLDARATHQGAPLAAPEKRLVLYMLLRGDESFYCDVEPIPVALQPWYKKCPGGDWTGAAFKIPDEDLDEAIFRVAAAYGMEELEADGGPDKATIVKLLPALVRNPKGSGEVAEIRTKLHMPPKKGKKAAGISEVVSEAEEENEEAEIGADDGEDDGLDDDER